MTILFLTYLAPCSPHLWSLAVMFLNFLSCLFFADQYAGKNVYNNLTLKRNSPDNVLHKHECDTSTAECWNPFNVWLQEWYAGVIIFAEKKTVCENLQCACFVMKMTWRGQNLSKVKHILPIDFWLILIDDKIMSWMHEHWTHEHLALSRQRTVNACWMLYIPFYMTTKQSWPLEIFTNWHFTFGTNKEGNCNYMGIQSWQ